MTLVASSRQSYISLLLASKYLKATRVVLLHQSQRGNSRLPELGEGIEVEFRAWPDAPDERLTFSKALMADVDAVIADSGLAGYSVLTLEATRTSKQILSVDTASMQIMRLDQEDTTPITIDDEDYRLAIAKLAGDDAQIQPTFKWETRQLLTNRLASRWPEIGQAIGTESLRSHLRELVNAGVIDRWNKRLRSAVQLSIGEEHHRVAPAYVDGAWLIEAMMMRDPEAVKPFMTLSMGDSLFWVGRIGNDDSAYRLAVIVPNTPLDEPEYEFLRKLRSTMDRPLLGFFLGTPPEGLEELLDVVRPEQLPATLDSEFGPAPEEARDVLESSAPSNAPTEPEPESASLADSQPDPSDEDLPPEIADSAADSESDELAEDGLEPEDEEPAAAPSVELSENERLQAWLVDVVGLGKKEAENAAKQRVMLQILLNARGFLDEYRAQAWKSYAPGQAPQAEPTTPTTTEPDKAPRPPVVPSQTEERTRLTLDDVLPKPADRPDLEDRRVAVSAPEAEPEEPQEDLPPELQIFEGETDPEFGFPLARISTGSSRRRPQNRGGRRRGRGRSRPAGRN